MNPLIVINYKTYTESSGKNSRELSKKIEKISKEIIVCPQIADLSEIKKNTKIKKVYAQHVDSCLPGKNTGFITIEELKSKNINGSLLNHSEHRLPDQEIKKTIQRAEEKKFQIILCVENYKEASKFLKYGKIYAVALEIPELISSGKSITEYKKEEVISFVKLIKKTNKKIKVLCGAGITTKQDILEAKKLGCDGVLIASAVVKSKDPAKILNIKI